MLCVALVLFKKTILVVTVYAGNDDTLIKVGFSEHQAYLFNFHGNLYL